MTLPASGAISLSQIQTEFGGVNPISLSEYYWDGSYVTANPENVGIAPAGNPISMSGFHGAAKLTTMATYTGTRYTYWARTGMQYENIGGTKRIMRFGYFDIPGTATASQLYNGGVGNWGGVNALTLTANVEVYVNGSNCIKVQPIYGGDNVLQYFTGGWMFSFKWNGANTTTIKGNWQKDGKGNVSMRGHTGDTGTYITTTNHYVSMVASRGQPVWVGGYPTWTIPW